MTRYPRDLLGYGPNPPHANWPGGANVAVQFVLNLAWTPLFFGMHQVGAALLVIVVMLVLAIVTTWLFGRIRPLAAWLEQQNKGKTCGW